MNVQQKINDKVNIHAICCLVENVRTYMHTALATCGQQRIAKTRQQRQELHRQNMCTKYIYTNTFTSIRITTNKRVKKKEKKNINLMGGNKIGKLNFTYASVLHSNRRTTETEVATTTTASTTLRAA